MTTGLESHSIISHRSSYSSHYHGHGRRGNVYARVRTLAGRGNSHHLKTRRILSRTKPITSTIFLSWTKWSQHSMVVYAISQTPQLLLYTQLTSFTNTSKPHPSLLLLHIHRLPLPPHNKHLLNSPLHTQSPCLRYLPSPYAPLLSVPPHGTRSRRSPPHPTHRIRSRPTALSTSSNGTLVRRRKPRSTEETRLAEAQLDVRGWIRARTDARGAYTGQPCCTAVR